MYDSSSSKYPCPTRNVTQELGPSLLSYGHWQWVPFEVQLSRIFIGIEGLSYVKDFYSFLSTFVCSLYGGLLVHCNCFSLLFSKSFIQLKRKGTTDNSLCLVGNLFDRLSYPSFEYVFVYKRVRSRYLTSGGFP